MSHLEAREADRMLLPCRNPLLRWTPLLRWMTGAWVTAVLLGTAWSVSDTNFPWDAKDSPIAQVAGVAFIYLLWALPLVIGAALVAFVLRRLLVWLFAGLSAPVRLAVNLVLSTALGFATVHGLAPKYPLLAMVGAAAGLAGEALASFRTE